jgi:hypothetical protein
VFIVTSVIPILVSKESGRSSRKGSLIDGQQIRKELQASLLFIPSISTSFLGLGVPMLLGGATGRIIIERGCQFKKIPACPGQPGPGGQGIARIPDCPRTGPGGQRSA